MSQLAARGYLTAHYNYVDRITVEPRLGQTKTFRKDSEAFLRAEGGRGYVILFSNEPSCCYVATSERRRIRLKADFHYFALRGVGDRATEKVSI